MKFQFLIEIDLKTTCHGRDKNCDAEVLSEREASTVLCKMLGRVLEAYAHASDLLVPTHMFAAQNITKVRVFRAEVNTPHVHNH